MKNYIGISRDHSGSMGSLRSAAAKDYNQNIAAIKANAVGQDTIVSVVSCGLKGAVKKEVVLSSAAALKPITDYVVDGSTPLFDSVGSLIGEFLGVPDANDPEVSFLVMAITDGEENASTVWGAQKLANEIRRLQATDRWTFVFRVPRGYSKTLRGLGIPEGNILEWDQTQAGLAKATAQTEAAIGAYYMGLKTGQKSSTRFFTNLVNVGEAIVKKRLTNVSSQLACYPVVGQLPIKECFERASGLPYRLGSVFYQLTKPEKAIQDHKSIIIRSRMTGECYEGQGARQCLGLPQYGTVSVAPGNHGDYDIFVQSTSVNRKLVPGTDILYWPAGAKGQAHTGGYTP